MSKAEVKGYEAYPVSFYEGTTVDVNEMPRDVFIEGYHQAEKDKELTWEDMREIYCITLNLRQHLGASVFGEPLYQEVLKHFNKERE